MIGESKAMQELLSQIRRLSNTDANILILGENGTGHGDVFEGVDGKLYYVYHVHNSDKKPTPRRTRIVELKETMGVDGVCRYEVDRRKVIVPVVVDFR